MEEVLIARLKNRDKTALSDMYDLYSANLYGVIIQIVKEKMLAEEAMQDCFVKIWFSIAFYNRDKGRLYTWLVTIARHVAIDKVRTRSYRQSRLDKTIDVVYENNTAEPHPFRPEHIGVKEVVDTLSSNLKEVIDLIYFEGYTHVEAAKELALPLGTVKTRVRLALQTLRKLTAEPQVLAA